MSLELRQHLKMTQQLVMTPQLQQAIKLLQLSRLELQEYIETELEQNPLLDVDTTRVREETPESIAERQQLRQRWDAYLETYGQEMGYSVTQVAMRAGHDPSIAAKHYSGRVAETDRALAAAVASLIAPGSLRSTD